MKYSKMFLLTGSLFFGLMKATTTNDDTAKQRTADVPHPSTGDVVDPGYHRPHIKTEHKVDCKSWWEERNKPNKLKLHVIGCRYNVNECENYEKCNREHRSKDACECWYIQAHLNQRGHGTDLLHPQHTTFPRP
jgi:hypothetical protein